MRARRLKPSFFDNPDLARCNPYSRLLFEGLWCYSDSFGRFKVQPDRIRANVFPYEPHLPVLEMLAELIAVRQIVIYQGENGSIFGAIPTAPEHFPQDSTKNLKERIQKPPKKVDIKQMLDLLSEKFGKLRPNSDMTIDILSIDILSIESPIGDRAAKDSPPPPPSDETPKPCPHKKIIELWNQRMPDLPQVDPESWTTTHEKWLAKIWRAEEGRQNLDWWTMLFEWIRESEWLMGKHKRNQDWKITLTWMVKPENWSKIVAKTYHQKKRTLAWMEEDY